MAVEKTLSTPWFVGDPLREGTGCGFAPADEEGVVEEA